MQHITNRDIVDANRRALTDGTLGAVQGFEYCSYDYGYGVRCAIGVVLNHESMAKVESWDLNSMSVNALVGKSRTNDVPFVEFEDIKVAKLTQNLHDAWAEERGLKPLSDWNVTLDIPIMIDFMLKKNISKDALINRELFEKWLDYVETER